MTATSWGRKHAARRVFNRISAFGLSAFVAVAAISSVRAAAPFRGIVANPAEDCSVSMNIGWHAGAACSNSFVTFTRKADTAWAHASKALPVQEDCDCFNGVFSKTAAGADCDEDAVFLRCGATLPGLEPGTDYMYKVCGGSNECSEVRYFRTAGPAECSFLWLGDFHCYTPLPNRTANAARVARAALDAGQGVDFVFSTGDVVAWGGSYSFWESLYEQDFIKQFMFANVLGNHDYMTRKSSGGANTSSSKFFRAVNNFPANGYPGQEGVCYWFRYGEVLFLTLNNESMAGNSAAEAAAKSWAADVIQRLKGNYRYIVIAEHYQWFNGRDGSANWYTNWKDFCDEHRVALALSGNNHIYERTHPLSHDQVVEGGKGTVYMEVPSSDGERGAEAGVLTKNADKLAFTYSSHVKSNKSEVRTIGCVLVRIGAGEIATKLVYLDDKKAPRVEDEHAVKALPAW